MRFSFFRIILVIGLLGAITASLIYRDQFSFAWIEMQLEQAGILAPVLFILIYATATVLFLPGSVLTLAGGALFGPLWGTVVNIVGATLGASLAFLISRHLASGVAKAKTGARLGQLKQGIDNEGWRFVAFARLVPLFPFNLLNYALGLTRIPFLHYVVATFVFMLPGAFAYTWLGFAGREAATGSESLVRNILIALAVLAATAFIPRIVRRMRQNPWLDVSEAQQRLDHDNALILDVRNADEFSGEQGHIENAVNISLASLEKGLTRLDGEQERVILIVCRTDKRSDKAADLLAAGGFRHAHVVRGGMTAWLEAQKPVIKN